MKPSELFNDKDKTKELLYGQEIAMQFRDNNRKEESKEGTIQ